MEKASFTTSSKATVADSVTIRSDDLDLFSLPPSKRRDFVLLCQHDNFAEAVHALYFLPENYKLMVIASGTNNDMNDETLADMTPFQDRIQIEAELTGTSNQESLYSFVDAVISNDISGAVSISGETPYVMVLSSTDSSGISTHGTNGLAVQSGHPEALASAILRIARQTL